MVQTPIPGSSLAPVIIVPNRGNANEPGVDVDCEYERAKLSAKKFTGNLAIKLVNLNAAHPSTVEIRIMLTKINQYKKHWQQAQ